MKPITIALFAALTGFATTAAKADNVRVNVGLGATYGPSYAAPVYVTAPARGHWENVTVKTWIPGRWVTSRDRWGRPVRFFEEGRYAFRTERVWIDHDHNYGRDYSNNYRGDRDGWNR